MNSKLSLDAFKAMAGEANETEVLEKVSGGSAASDCHNWLAEMNKALDRLDQWFDEL